MFDHIMVPYELNAKDQLAKSVKVAGALARTYEARITLVSVTGWSQGMNPRSVEDYERLLGAFAAQIAQSEKVEVGSRVYDTTDVGAEVDRKLLDAIDDIGADLVVMATHRPGWVEYLVNSHGGRMARHAPVSVFVVRE